MIEYLIIQLLRILFRWSTDNAGHVATGLSRAACRCVTVGLSPEAKAACENEILYHLNEEIWRDLKHALSAEAVVFRAMSRSAGLLSGWVGLRSDYRLMSKCGDGRIALVQRAAEFARVPWRYWAQYWKLDRYTVVVTGFSFCVQAAITTWKGLPWQEPNSHSLLVQAAYGVASLALPLIFLAYFQLVLDHTPAVARWKQRRRERHEAALEASDGA